MIIEHDGISQSVEDWALDYGIPADLIVARLKTGWSKAAAIETEIDDLSGDQLPAIEIAPTSRIKKFTGQRYDHDGKSLTLAEWSIETGIRAVLIASRLSQGWTIARAVGRAGRYRRSNLYDFDGRSLRLAEWSALSGITEYTLKSRIRNGWSIERAVTERPQLSGTGPRQRGGAYIPACADRRGKSSPSKLR